MTPPGGLILWLIAAEPRFAEAACRAGVGRVLVDLERHRKAERQVGRGLFLSDHRWEDIPRLRAVLPAGALFVRLDPWHDESPAQVERALAMAVDGLMLPYFHDAAPVLRFVDAVAGRAIATPLVETLGAVAALPDLLARGAVDEFHVGLNDLALDAGLESLASLWGAPILDTIAGTAREHGTAFGIGGVTDPRLTGLPVSPMHVLAEQRRLGSTRALLGRSFRRHFADRPEVAAIAEAVDAIQAGYAG